MTIFPLPQSRWPIGPVSKKEKKKTSEREKKLHLRCPPQRRRLCITRATREAANPHLVSATLLALAHHASLPKFAASYITPSRSLSLLLLRFADQPAMPPLTSALLSRSSSTRIPAAAAAAVISNPAGAAASSSSPSPPPPSSRPRPASPSRPASLASSSAAAAPPRAPRRPPRPSSSGASPRRVRGG